MERGYVIGIEAFDSLNGAPFGYVFDLWIKKGRLKACPYDIF